MWIKAIAMLEVLRSLCKDSRKGCMEHFTKGYHGDVIRDFIWSLHSWRLMTSATCERGRRGVFKQERYFIDLHYAVLSPEEQNTRAHIVEKPGVLKSNHILHKQGHYRECFVALTNYCARGAAGVMLNVKTSEWPAVRLTRIHGSFNRGKFELT